MPGTNESRPSTSFVLPDDLSQSVGQFCSQFSLSNVKINPFSSYDEVGDFITEFELATTELSDNQKLKILAKAFPPGRHRSWFENELKPIVVSPVGTWRQAREKLLSRFSDAEDRDKHFERIKDLKFDPEDGKSLLEFIDDLTFSYKKAFPFDQDTSSLVRFIKVSIPSKLKPALNVYQEYRDANNVDTLRKAAKQFDLSRALPSSSKSTDKTVIREFTSVIQELVQSIKKDNEATRNSIVAAFTAQSNRQNRSPSPHRYRQAETNRKSEYQNDYMQKSFDNYTRRRSVSPANYTRNYNNRTPPQRTDSPKPLDQVEPNDNVEVFNSRSYFARFGKPKRPCKHCDLWHWERHCYEHLN